MGVHHHAFIPGDLLFGRLFRDSLSEGSMMQKHLACLVGFCLISVEVFGDEPAWRYVAEVAADSPIRPVFRSVALSNKQPDELREEVQYRGKEQKYAQIRYGSDDSRRVVVVVDEVSRDDFDLYVDANRNRVIEAKDKIAGTGKERTAPLDVEITRDLQIVHERRLVQWRLGATRKTICLATLGYVEGVVLIAGKKHSVRRVDAGLSSISESRNSSSRPCACVGRVAAHSPMTR